MERMMSQEERIRRAEEIYFQRRSQQRQESRTAPVYGRKKSSSCLLKKMLLQIGISFLIYFMVYLIKGNEYVFSESFMNQISQILNEEVNVEKTWQVIQEKAVWFHQKISAIGVEEKEEKQEEEKEKEPEKEEKKEVETQNEETKETQEQPEEQKEQEKEGIGVGGGREESQDTNLSQMEIDAKFIKENYEIGLPLEGRISSHFGPRTPTDIVSANHFGTDIAIGEGSEIRSILEGTVVLVSEVGDYGKHIKIQNGEISVLYAHCSELDVTEGQEIKKGDLIAKVGSTGKATGPHLHIEIKREDRYIDPELILPF